MALTHSCLYETNVNSFDHKLKGLAPFAVLIYAYLTPKHMIKIFDDSFIWTDQHHDSCERQVYKFGKWETGVFLSLNMSGSEKF